MYIILYDEEFMWENESLEECFGYILENYKGWVEGKEKYASYYEEDEEFPFYLYRIISDVVTTDEIEERVKNNC